MGRFLLRQAIRAYVILVIIALIKRHKRLKREKENMNRNEIDKRES